MTTTATVSASAIRHRARWSCWRRVRGSDMAVKETRRPTARKGPCSGRSSMRRSGLRNERQTQGPKLAGQECGIAVPFSFDLGDDGGGGGAHLLERSRSDERNSAKPRAGSDEVVVLHECAAALELVVPVPLEPDVAVCPLD